MIENGVKGVREKEKLDLQILEVENDSLLRELPL